MSNITEITSEQFSNEVKESTVPVLVDFYGHSCPPCIRMLPIIEEIAGECADKLKVVKMNAHDNMEIASSFRINSIPSFMLLKNGQPLAQRSGSTTKAELLQWIDSTLS